jgi:hypothetical protein
MTDKAGRDVDQDLEVWVKQVLVAGYELWAQVPECWSEHPGVVAELAALQALHGDADTTAKVVEFHDTIDRVLRRLKDQYPTRECLRNRRHEIPRRWASQPDLRTAVRHATRQLQSGVTASTASTSDGQH